MFPNQQGRDSWGSVAGYYGNYGMHTPSLSGSVAGNSWYNRAAAGQSGAGWSAWGVGAGYSSEGMSGDEANERAMMASLSSMEREAAAEMMARTENFSQQSQRPKLGINSNIYSLYQTKQSRGLGDTMQGYGGSMSDSLYKSTLQSTKSPELIHKQAGPEPESDSVYVSDQRQSFDEAHDISRDSHLRHSIGSNCSDGKQMYSSCMQQPGDKVMVESSVTSKEEDPVVTTMEPDSSTDGVHPGGKNVNNGGGVSQDKDATESDLEEENDSNEDRMQKLLKEHARLFNNVKNEPEGSSYDGAKRLKTYKTAQEELAELMKLTNEKLFKNANPSRSSSLPLSVEIDAEQDSSSDSVSPPRNPFMITNSLSPRKRGRKPKHYSEILYELGQRGISITKTAKGGQGPSPGPGNSLPGHNPTEMVVSENGSVSHKASGQQLKCPHCNKILTTSVGLMYHIRLHTGEKPYSCDICGKSFATSSHYHYHIRSHSGEKPYRCDFCGKMYTASGSLRLHLKSHLSRLAANAFSSMSSLPGFNMSQNLASLASGGAGDPLTVGPNDFKFGIKQEVFENNDASESVSNINDEGSVYPKESSETIRSNAAAVEDEH